MPGPGAQALASLVRYDNPVLVSTTGKGGKGAKAGGKKVGPLRARPAPSGRLCLRHAHVRYRSQGALPPVEQKPGLTQTEDILNSILPPR
jgi:dynein light intermediate chain